jgi:hypothetical protein
MNRKQSRECLEKVARQGDRDACLVLALLDETLAKICVMNA